MSSANKFNSTSILIDWIALFLLLTWEVLIKSTNLFGLAWWAKVQTKDPDIIYWFGPFLTKNSLKKDLQAFLYDLSQEEPGEISYNLIKCSCRESPKGIYCITEFTTKLGKKIITNEQSPMKAKRKDLELHEDTIIKNSFTIESDISKSPTKTDFESINRPKKLTSFVLVIIILLAVISLFPSTRYLLGPKDIESFEEKY